MEEARVEQALALRADAAELGYNASVGEEMHRSTRIFLLPILFLSIALLNSVAQDQKKPEPLTEGEIIRLLQGSVPPERVERLARERGITFEVTPAVERDLAEAGATDHLVRTLRDLEPGPGRAEPKKEIPKTATPQAAGTLLITVDAPSKVTVDGEEVGELTPDAPKRIAAPIGEHLVEAVSKEEPAARVEWTGKVETPEQVVVQLRMADKVASVKKAREDGEREAAEKERLKPLQPYLGILGRWTHHDESSPGERPCRFVETSSEVYEFRPEGLHGTNLQGKGTGHVRIAGDSRNRYCAGATIDLELTYDLILSYQAGEGVYKYRQTVTACSGTCKGATIGQSAEGTIRLESPTVLVMGAERFQKDAE